jgi:hypothetical protein
MSTIDDSTQANTNENLQKVQNLTEELKKASDKAKEQLAEFDKLNAQRELEKKKEDETIEDDRPTLITLKCLITTNLKKKF